MSSKRKREASFASDLSAPPPSAQAINPHSYPPAKLAQFAVAGLSDADEDPLNTVKDFPHRGLSHKPTEQALESDYDTGFEDETDGDDQPTPKADKPKRPPDAHRKHLDILIKSIHQFLGQGDVVKAARAFGIALQLRPHHRPVDIRRHNLWALGAEVIMREGEEKHKQNICSQQVPDNTQNRNDEAHAREGFDIPRRWGSAANMGKLRAYFDTLVQQHPYDYKSPKTISALHFNISLYSCEIYNIYSEYTSGLSRPSASADDSLLDDDSDLRLTQDDSHAHLETLLEDESFHALRRRRTNESISSPKDSVRLRTMEVLKTVIGRMDVLMREMPYTKNHELLRLRATASLFMADLAVPFERSASVQLDQASDQRRQEIATAKRALQMVMENGGVLDDPCRALAESDDLDETVPIESQLYSILPIRKA